MASDKWGRTHDGETRLDSMAASNLGLGAAPQLEDGARRLEANRAAPLQALGASLHDPRAIARRGASGWLRVGLGVEPRALRGT